MIINSINIKNFQTYFGNIEFEFDQPSDEKNVVLIGGLNGAGKTSFFSSIVLGLFGKNAEGIIFERSSGENIDDSYQTYLQEVFSNEAKKANDIEMEIALSITHEETNIKIVRKWWFDSSIDEILEIYTEKDGTVIPLEIPEEDVERNEYYEAFIQSIIPSQVGRFFFFDGEEIKAIAKQDPEQAVINGINALLGFDVLEQLVVDLETLKRNLRKELPGAANSGLLKNYEELEKLESTLSSAEEEKKYCTEDIDGMNIHLEELEKDISEAFKGRDVDNRNEILDKIFNLDKELSAVENELQTLVGEVLSVALPSVLITETEKKLSKEINTLKQQDQSAVINSLKNKFNRQLIKNLPKEIKDNEKIIREAAVLTWDEMNNSSTRKASIMSNYFSDDEIKVAFNHIQEIKATTNREISRLVGKQDALLKKNQNFPCSNYLIL